MRERCFVKQFVNLFGWCNPSNSFCSFPVIESYSFCIILYLPFVHACTFISTVGRIDISGCRVVFWDLGGQEDLQMLWEKVRNECSGCFQWWRSQSNFQCKKNNYTWVYVSFKILIFLSIVNLQDEILQISYWTNLQDKSLVHVLFTKSFAPVSCRKGLTGGWYTLLWAPGPLEAHQDWGGHGLRDVRACVGAKSTSKQSAEKLSGIFYDGHEMGFVASCYVKYLVAPLLLSLQVKINH